MQNGTANIAFDYRIVAKRKGYEQTRLAEPRDEKLAELAPEIKLAENRN